MKPSTASLFASRRVSRFAAFVLLLAASLTLGSPPTLAASRDSLLMDANTLAHRLASDRQLVVLHVGNPDTYAAGHIPGARLVTPGMVQRPRGDDPAALLLELPQPEALRDQLQAVGIERRSRIVVVFGKDELPAATRVVYTLDAAGFGERVSLLDGGQPAWVRAGHPLSTETPAVVPTRLPLPKLRPHAVDIGFLQASSRARPFVLIDARAPEFYSGVQRSRYPTGEAPAGHLPGARSLPFSSITKPDLALKSRDDLTRLFADAGVKKGDKVVVYCHIGQQASAVLFAARLAGIDASLYDGSFQEWTARGLPVQPSP